MSEPGLAWGRGQKPNPGPTWCAKRKPCDFDRGSAYCPHRECRQRLLDEHEYLAGKLIAAQSSADPSTSQEQP